MFLVVNPLCFTDEVGSLIDRKLTDQKNTLSLLYNVLLTLGSAVLTVGLILPHRLYPNIDGHPGVS
ncbi:MAG: hypothetical protein KGD64_13935, partial [Candidatus Heimdallarchaeota archaeon]|nr:hypothetical protein [Candidatus Heimdallarchaeota archaeon]